MELIGIFFVGCGLLALAGVAKAVRPADTARALALLLAHRMPRASSLAATRPAVRIGALLEAALGILALLFPRPLLAASVATSYALFACVVGYARRHGGPLSTCGCFGRPDTPATGLHVLLNVVFVAVAVAVAAQPPTFTSLPVVLAHQPWHGVPLLMACGTGVWLTYLALSPLATLEGARRLATRADRKALTT